MYTSPDCFERRRSRLAYLRLFGILQRRLWLVSGNIIVYTTHCIQHVLSGTSISEQFGQILRYLLILSIVRARQYCVL
jgi:hypothetical protein